LLNLNKFDYVQRGQAKINKICGPTKSQQNFLIRKKIRLDFGRSSENLEIFLLNFFFEKQTTTLLK